MFTEVSEDDLLNMVEKKRSTKAGACKEEPVKEEVKPEKKDEKSNLGTYIILPYKWYQSREATITLVKKESKDKKNQDFCKAESEKKYKKILVKRTLKNILFYQAGVTSFRPLF